MRSTFAENVFQKILLKLGIQETNCVADEEASPNSSAGSRLEQSPGCLVHQTSGACQRTASCHL